MDQTPNDRLRHFRIEELNLSQKDMAQTLGMQQGSYSDIERGRVGVSGILTKLIKSFNINPIWLVEGFGKKKLEDISYLYDESTLTVVSEDKEKYAAQDDAFQLMDELEKKCQSEESKQLVSHLKSVVGKLIVDNNEKLNEINELKGTIIDLYRKRENLKNIIKKF